jgi:hypothetical protein
MVLTVHPDHQALQARQDQLENLVLAVLRVRHRRRLLR